MKPKGKLVRRLPEAKVRSGPLTDKKMKSMIPFFVDGRPGEDHKCGSCSMRIPPNTCTVVRGTISLAAGTCLYWSRGDAATHDEIHDARMPQPLAQYAEYSGPVRCETCRFYQSRGRGAGGHCTLWHGTVKVSDCCISFDAPDLEIQ